MSEGFEKICVYNSCEFVEIPYHEECHSMELFEIRKFQGFTEHREIASPYHYNDNDFYSIDVFTNSKYESICEYWNQTGYVFQFFTKNESDTFELIRKFVGLVKDISIIENNVKFMEEEQKVRLVNEE